MRINERANKQYERIKMDLIPLSDEKWSDYHICVNSLIKSHLDEIVDLFEYSIIRSASRANHSAHQVDYEWSALCWTLAKWVRLLKLTSSRVCFQENNPQIRSLAMFFSYFYLLVYSQL